MPCRLFTSLALACVFAAGALATLSTGTRATAAPAGGTDPYVELTLTARAVKSVPARPRAGARFSLSMLVIRTDTGAALRTGAVRCHARAGARRARLLVKGLRRGRASCAWRVPAGTRGRTLRASVRVSFGGAAVTRRVAKRIR